LIANGKHCLSDLVSDFVALFAKHASRKDADKDHPFGHHRFETALLALRVMLMAVGVGIVGNLWAIRLTARGGAAPVAPPPTAAISPRPA
jgi:divalent metal cation (Fe/Co/Zn/Cd) transporter